LRRQTLEAENVSLRQQLDTKFGLENVIGESPAMEEVFEVVQQVAPTRATVMLSGESGTGKELIAKAIHRLSPRAKQPLVVVHCAALSATLLESELFGHERGAFTGAHERRIGRFEQAQGGTLFLDEIAEIDATVQIKLLRFLGERTFERVGSNKTLTADVRLIAATNKNLEELVKTGTFREDLFFRLRVVEIALPALRERTGDIPLLALSFLHEFARENGKPVTLRTLQGIELLQTGNVFRAPCVSDFQLSPGLGIDIFNECHPGRDIGVILRQESDHIETHLGMCVSIGQKKGQKENRRQEMNLLFHFPSMLSIFIFFTVSASLSFITLFPALFHFFIDQIQDLY